MKNFDEYQKFMRYKYGYQAFGIVLVLTLINYFMSLFMSLLGETRELETMVIVLIAIMYSLIMYIYKGAYFTKKQNHKLYAVIFFLIGVLNIFNSLSPYTPLIADGKITSNFLILIAGILWLSIPATYVTRMVVEKKRASKR
ncbi:MAG: hypothetical protein U5K84_14515 [Alkalibacterium sp.]|nr:hypothetical protein [Alkalibacterium sp.]